MNSQGATPVVVMNPLHPALLRALERHGGFARHTWAVRYLQALRRRYRFDFIDLTDVRTFPGLPNGFADPTHVSVANMRLMLRYIVARDHGSCSGARRCSSTATRSCAGFSRSCSSAGGGCAGRGCGSSS